MSKKPEVVCLCGSTKFKEQFIESRERFTRQGNIVVGPEIYIHADGIELNEYTKIKLDVLHFAKIDLADWVYIVTVDNYIGESTEREIAYAKMRGKRVGYSYYTSTEEEDYR